jgi:hypothetical protein
MIINIRPDQPSEKSFGIVFSIVFFLIGVYLFLKGSRIYVLVFYFSILFIFLAYVAPKFLSYPNWLWFKFGLILGVVVSPVIIGFVYFSTVVPIGLIMKLIGKDLLNQKLDKKSKTYWQTKEAPTSTMQDQF